MEHDSILTSFASVLTRIKYPVVLRRVPVQFDNVHEATQVLSQLEEREIETARAFIQDVDFQMDALEQEGAINWRFLTTIIGIFLVVSVLTFMLMLVSSLMKGKITRHPPKQISDGASSNPVQSIPRPRKRAVSL